jgi:cytochrome c553
MKKSRFQTRIIALLLGLAGPLACGAAPEPPDDSATLASMLEQMRRIETDPALNTAAITQGAKVAELCANCHGANGYSKLPETPNLAGQNPRYLLGQMHKFATGQRRYEFMEGLIKAMTPQERVSAVLFFANQQVPTRAPTDVALAAKGKAYFEKVCFRCHGSNARGGEEYARLAGQQVPYVTLAVKRYRENTGDRRKDPVMADTVKMMSDDDINAVATYVSTLP